MANLVSIVALGCVTVALASVAPSARAEPAPSRAVTSDTSSDGETQNLISGKPTFGGYGGPEIKGTPIMHVASALVGAQGGMVLNHAFVIGGAGYGLVTRTDLPQELQTPGSSRRLDFGYGGAQIEWIVMPRSLVHGTVGALIGGGGLVWQSNSGTYTYENGVLVPDKSTRNDAFFVLEPHVALELNIHKLVRLDAVASYRWIRGVESAGLSDADFRGVAFGAVTRFGVF